MKNKIKKAIQIYNNLPVQIRASFWFLICSFLQKGISFLTTPIFTRIMSTEEYGQFHVFNSWLEVITVFVSLNLYQGVYMQGLIKFNHDRKQFSSTMQSLGTVLVLAWTVIYLAFSSFWNDLFSLTTVQMLAMLAMIWSTSAFRFWSSAQRVEYKYRTLVIVTLIISLLKPTTGIIFVKLSADKVTARIISLALVEVIGYSAFFILQLYRGKKLFSAYYWKYALSFNIPLIPHYLSNTVLHSADRIMVKEMVGASEAGIYSLAYSVAMVMIIFNTALQQTLEPWRLSRIKEGKEKEIPPIAYSTLILVALINTLLIAFAPEVIRICGPASYYAAIWVMPPVSMSVYFMFFYGFFACFEFYYKKTTYTAIATTSGAVLNIVLNYICIRLFGYIAAGYTTLVCYVTYAIAHYFFMRKIYKENGGKDGLYDIKILLTISLVFVSVGFLFLLTYNHIYVRYSLLLVIIIGVWIKRKKLMEVLTTIIKIKKKKEI